MYDIGQYTNALVAALVQRFGERLAYVGLQGSYLRGEATKDSDIDIMVVIDALEVADLDAYRDTVRSVSGGPEPCGFIGGRAELANWNPLEVCHLLHSTKDYYGTLAELVPGYTREDVRNFAKLSVNNLYHEICHRYIYSAPEKNAAKLTGVYKQAFFILQNVHYLRTGVFAQTKQMLLPQLSGRDRQVLSTAVALQNGAQYEYRPLFEQLYAWCQETMVGL